MKKINIISRWCNILVKVVSVMVAISTFLWIGGLFTFFIYPKYSKIILISFSIFYLVAILFVFLWSKINRINEKAIRDYIYEKFCAFAEEKQIRGIFEVNYKRGYSYYIKVFTFKLNKIDYNEFTNKYLEKINEPYTLFVEEINVDN